MVTKKSTRDRSKASTEEAPAKSVSAKKKRPTLKVQGSRAASATRPAPVKRVSRRASESVPGESVSVAPSAPKAPKKPRSKKSATTDQARQTALAVASAALDRKALHVEIIDLRGKVDYADYVVVMSGTSDRHVGAIARHVEDELRVKEKIRCLGVEGLPQGWWVLMDFGDVIVHIFHEDTRGLYDLESLWSDAARLPVA